MELVKKSPRGNFNGRARANPVAGCPLTAALAALGGKWKLIIIDQLAESTKHFAALRRTLPGVSQKVLAQQLAELVTDGLVNRTPTGAIPARVEYSLTDYGRTALPLVEQMLLWGRSHLTDQRYGKRKDVGTH